MKKITYVLRVNILSFVILFLIFPLNIAKAQQRLKPVQPSLQPPTKISVSISPALQKQLEQIGNRLKNNQEFINTVNKIDRSLVPEAIKSVRMIQQSGKISKQQVEFYRKTMGALGRNIDSSGLTYFILNRVPGLTTDFNFSNPQFIKIELQLLKNNGIRVTADLERDLLNLASKAENNKRQLNAKMKMADPNTQCAPRMEDPGYAGGRGVGGGNISALIDGMRTGDWVEIAIGLLSIAIAVIGALT